MDKNDASNDARRCVATELSSGVTYEFRVAGANEFGIGPWTESSAPICTKKIHSKLLEGPLPVHRKLVVESGHPYGACLDLKEKVRLSGCKFGCRVEFDKRTKLEPDCDILCFYDDSSYDDVMVGWSEGSSEEISCVFDGDYKRDKGDETAWGPVVDLCREQKGVGELGVDKDFHFGFFSDEQNQYWGYRFTISWEDWTETERYSQAAKAERNERKGARGDFLLECSAVKELQVKEEAEKMELLERAAEIRRQLAGTMISDSGEEIVLPVSKITPRFMDGTENCLVAPVRKQQLQLFPSYGGKRNDGDDDDDEQDDADSGLFTPEKARVESAAAKADLAQADLTLDISAWRKDAKQQQEAIVRQKDVVGSPDQRQVHFLKLKSAYRGYCAAGEPLYTCVDGKLGAHAADFILASEEGLVCVEVLNIPELGGECSGGGEDDSISVDKRERAMEYDPNYELVDGFESQWEADREAALEGLAREEMEREIKREKEEWERSEAERIKSEQSKRRAAKKKTRGGGKGRAEEPANDVARPMPASKVKLKQEQKRASGGYCGQYTPFIRENPLRNHSIIPNVIHPSNHFPLVARYRFSPSLLSGMWHGGQEDEKR